MQEAPLRSILKAFSWRITATAITILASWIIIGDITPALSIGFIEFFSKLLIYYLHERAWARVSIGRVRLPSVHEYPAAESRS